MKGRYLIVVAVLLLSLSLLALPADHDESSATTPLTPGDLTSTMELTDSFQSFSVDGHQIQIKASHPGTQGQPPATIGVYNSKIYLVADSYPENYPSGDSNEITIQWAGDNQTEERTFAVTNLGADKATSVFLLTYSRGIQVTLSYGGMGIPSTFGDSFYAESTDAGSSLSGGFRTDTGCIIDITNKLFEGSLITGIAGRKGFNIVTITKNGMSSEVGSLRRILEIFERFSISIAYAPSGVDCYSVVIENKQFEPCRYACLAELQKEIEPDHIHVSENIAIVAVVGRKMVFRTGSSGRIFAALGESGVNIRMISQGPEELNIIIGMKERDYETAVRTLYERFIH